jgi:hypothetical protein
MRFLREEISSLEYAEAVTGCARLEGLYRAPAARFAFPPRPGLADALLDALRLFCTVGGLAIALLVLLPFLAPLGARLAASAMQWAWTLSLVGAFLLAVTVRSEAASLILSTAHSIQRFVIAHQRASAR